MFSPLAGAPAISSGTAKITQGDAAEATKILDLFDKFKPSRNLTIPPPRD